VTRQTVKPATWRTYDSTIRLHGGQCFARAWSLTPHRIIPQVPWRVTAVQLPDGDHPSDFWVDTSGCLTTTPVPDAETLPGTYVIPGLVDAHAHPAVAATQSGPAALGAGETLAVLAAWGRTGVTLARDVGSPGGVSLELERQPGMPRLQAAGRFLAPPGAYLPVLLPEGAPEERLTELALAELARGARWVKLIADFPPLVDGAFRGAARATYSHESVVALVAAVHAMGGRVAAHSTSDTAAGLVAAGVDSLEHGNGIDEATLHRMAGTGAAWTPTLCAVLNVRANVPDDAMRVEEYRARLRELLPRANRLGVPILTGTDTAGTVAREVALLAECGLEPRAALAAATTAAYAFLGEAYDLPGRPASLVTYDADPRDDLAVLSAPSAILIDGTRVR